MAQWSVDSHVSGAAKSPMASPDMTLAGEKDIKLKPWPLKIVKDKSLIPVFGKPNFLDL